MPCKEKYSLRSETGWTIAPADSTSSNSVVLVPNSSLEE